MRFIFFTFLMIAMPVMLCAQETVVPSITNSAAIDGSVNEIFVTTSIGEPSITTLTTTHGFITQGFLQPEPLPCTNLEFKCYPNPTIDVITVETSGCEVGIQSVQVIDLWGRIITTVTKPKENQVSLVDLAQGVYLLKVKLTNDDVHAISVVKISN